MGTCVIAADTLNEGYQSVQVWRGGRARVSEKRRKEAEGEAKIRDKSIKVLTVKDRGTSSWAGQRNVPIYRRRSLLVSLFVAVTPVCGGGEARPAANWDPNLLQRSEKALTWVL